MYRHLDSAVCGGGTIRPLPHLGYVTVYRTLLGIILMVISPLYFLYISGSKNVSRGSVDKFL
jgi:hypothetical protein